MSIQESQKRAQLLADEIKAGVNDHHGTIWYPPLNADGIPVCQPDYQHAYAPPIAAQRE